MAGLFQPKRVVVPGLLSDEGLAAQVKELTSAAKTTAANAPPNSSAVEFADQVTTLEAGKLSKVAETKTRLAAQDARSEKIGSDIAGAVSAVPGVKEISQIGLLTDEQAAKEQAARVKSAQEEVDYLRDLNKAIETGKVPVSTIPGSDQEKLQYAVDQAAGRRRELIQAEEELARLSTGPALKYEWWRNAAEVAARSAIMVGVDTLKYPASVWDLTAETITGEKNRNEVGIYLDGVDKALTKMLPGDPARAKDFVTDLASGAGSMTGFMIGGFASRAVGLPAAVGSGVLGAAVTGNAQYEDAQNFDASTTEKWIALIAGTGLGATEAIPIDRAFFRADVATGGLVRQLLKNTTATSLEEFTQELAQSAGQDLIAKFTYDEDRDLDPAAWLRQATVGAIVGGGSGAVISLIEQGGERREVEVAKTDDTAMTTAAQEEIDAAQAEFDTALGDEAADLPGLGGTVDGVPGDQAAQAPAGDGAVAGAPGAGAQAAVARPDPVVVGDSVKQIIEKAKPVKAVSATPKMAAATEVVLDPTVPVEQQVSVQVAPAVETPEFKQWFGEGTVVDEAGAPLPVYHGTATAPQAFSAIEGGTRNGDMLGRGGVYVTNDPAYASKFGSSVMPLYTSAQNVIEERDIPPDIAAKGMRAVREWAQDVGYDAIRAGLGTRDDGTPAWQMLVFEPTQIKSAIGNDGSFDADDPNIDSQVGRPADPDIVAQVDAVQLEPHQVSPLPDIEKGLTGPIPRVVQAAKAYANAIGLPHRRARSYVKVDTARAARVADAYAAMKHEPNGPAVQASYRALADETLAQYQYVKASGIKIETILPGQPDPYPNGPRDVLVDLRENNHIWYFPTEQGFGSSEFDPTGNPLLDATDEVSDNGQPMVVNDLFRVVHDYFGHGLEGSGFGARGEENAWQSHMRLFTASAVPAMTSETRGQNSWVNYGPFGEKNRADRKNTTYADQKTGLMPSWTWTEGVVDSTADDVDAPVELSEGSAWWSAVRFRGRTYRAESHAEAVFRIMDAFPSEDMDALEAEIGSQGVDGYVDEDGLFVPRESGNDGTFGHASSLGNAFADAFLAAKNASPFGAAVHAYSPAEYAQMRTFLAPDGLSGFALKGEDIVSVFSHPAAGGGRLRKIIDVAVANGGRTLDAFDGKLVQMYSALGFREVRRESWNDEYRPEGWKDEWGKPDVVYMEYDGDIERSVASVGTESAAFREWDNDAAIREPGEGASRYARPSPGHKGAPLLLYSGAPKSLRKATRDMWLTPARNTAVNFGDASKGGDFAQDAAFDEDGNNIGGAVFTFYARMENPYEIDWQGNRWNAGPDTEYPTIYRAVGEVFESYGDAEQAISDAQDKAREDAEEAFRDEMANRMYVEEVDGQFEVRIKSDNGLLLVELRNALARNESALARYRDSVAALERRLAEGGDTGGMQATLDDYLNRIIPVTEAAIERDRSSISAREAAGEDAEVFSPFDTEEEARDFENTYTEEKATEAGDAAADEVDTTIDEETDYDSEGNGQTTDSVVEQARYSGHDGVIFRDVDEGSGPVDVYVVIEPGNAKSTANIGTWNREDPDILRMIGTSSTRQPYALEPTRPTRGVAARPDEAPNDVTLSRIASNLTKTLNLTVRHGRLASKGSEVMGEFNRRTGVVRLRTWTDLSTLAHEAGHALNDMMAAPLDAFVQGHLADFNAIARRLYGGDLSQAPAATVRREGFAEFFRVYTMTPDFARNRWSQLTADFEALLEREDPKIKSGLNAVAAQVRAWQQMPSGRLIENGVIDGRREQGLAPAMKELRDLGFKGWMQEMVRRNVQWSTNRYAALNRLVADLLNEGEQNRGAPIDLARGDDPRTLIRLARNSGSRAMVQVVDGVIGYRGTQSMSRGLREAIMVSQGVNPDSTPAAFDEERLHTFSAYLVARRALEEFRRFEAGELDRAPVSFSKGDAVRAVREWEREFPDFVNAAQIVHEYGMALWQKSYDAGLISKETYEENLTRQFYVPLQRDMSDKRAAFGDSALTSQGSGPLRSIVRRFRGSDRDIIDPLAILMQKTFALDQLIAENDAKKALAVLSDRVGQAGALVERIPAHQLIGQQYGVGEIARKLTDLDDISDTDAADLMTLLGASIKDGDTISLFRSQQAAAKGEPVLFFWENGKVAAIQVKDGDIGADVVNTMNAIGRENMDKWLEGIAATSAVFRTAITSWPDFLMVNFVRDQLSAWILTDVGFTPFVSGVRGVIDEVRQKGWAKLYNASQGTMGGMNVAALHTARVDRDIRSLRAKGYVANVFGEVRSGWDFPNVVKGLARVSALTETGTRLGLFKGAYDRAKREGLDDYQASVEAAYTATDYIDFGLNGSSMLTTRRLIPFLNAQIQGFYKMVRTLGGDEVAQRKGLMFALTAYFRNINNLPLSRTEKQALRTGRAAWLKMMSLGLISAALHFLFKDDEDYQEAGEYLRTTGWVIPMGNGNIAYIPKPFELAMFANAAERGLEAASGDGEAVNRFLRGVAFNLTPPTTPPAFQLAFELPNNIDTFTGREIVPTYMRALAPELQFDHTTSSLAKGIGETFRWSPMVVDHVLGAFGASAYRDIATMLNAADPTRPSMATTDTPILRRFVRDVRRGSVSAQDFWSQASSTNGKLMTAAASYKREVDIGNEPAANKRLAAMTADQRGFAVLMTHFKAEEKRLNPFYRATQVTTLISGMRRETSSALSLADTTLKDSGETIPLTAAKKREVDTLLSEIARREVRNTLIATGQPGWKGKEVLPVEPTMDMLLRVSPEVYDELQRRWKKRKIYDAQTVYEYWPDVRDRLVQDGEFAILSDAVAVASAGL